MTNVSTIIRVRSMTLISTDGVAASHATFWKATPANGPETDEMDSVSCETWIHAPITRVHIKTMKLTATGGTSTGYMACDTKVNSSEANPVAKARFTEG